MSKTQTAEADVCILWSDVTDAHIGSEICVYGRVVKLAETGVYAQIVRFSDEAGTFLLKSRWYTYLGLARGHCVAAVGYISRDGNYLAMEIGATELYEYDDCP
jgi:hypothetical protein